MADRQILLPQPVIGGRAFGRNINHDPESLRYKIPAQAVTPKSVEWDIFIPILNQADIGKCVAETGAEALGSEIFWKTLPREVQLAISTSVSTAETWTSALYRELTRADTFPGSWEPDDTGSDGLTLAKVLTKRGLINGYQHATTVAEAEAAIQRGPFAAGTIWLADMMTPRADGTLRISGKAVGGHEYLCFKRDAERDLWWFRNHWTARWGLKGTFAYDTPALQKLMSMQGDITSFVPLSAPKPTPTPAPGPATPTTGPQPDWARLDPFLAHPRSYKNQDAAVAELQRLKAAVH
jgi:hypothetical protein